MATPGYLMKTWEYPHRSSLTMGKNILHRVLQKMFCILMSTITSASLHLPTSPIISHSFCKYRIISPMVLFTMCHWMRWYRLWKTQWTAVTQWPGMPMSATKDLSRTLVWHWILITALHIPKIRSILMWRKPVMMQTFASSCTKTSLHRMITWCTSPELKNQRMEKHFLL